ncbi:MAG: MFS transporter [Phycisphaeraceae bacterium]
MSNEADTLSAVEAPRRSAGIRLCVMMFLQYAVWGVWLPYLANYLGATPEQGGLGFSGTQIGWILGLAGSIGAIAAPFIAGQVADRYLNAERALALLLILGGVVKYVTAYQTTYMPWLVLSVVYSVLYMPTLALTNSVAFANLDDPEKKFPPIRSLGTIGWIVASTLFPLWWLNTDDPVENTRRIADALRVSGVVSVLYGLYCVTLLPKTPPKRDTTHPLAFAEAFGLLRHRGFLLVTLVALPISMIHQCYFIRTGPYLENAVGLAVKWVGPVMSIGQWSEIVFLALLGLFIKRLGYKWVLILGTGSYALRYGLFALQEPTWMVIGAMTLHGLNYGCFFAGAFLYVEKVAPENIRHSAQTVFGIVILGIGPVLAGVYNGYFDRFTDPAGQQQYHQFWWTQSAIALAATLALLTLFNEGWRSEKTGNSAASVD